MRRKKRPGNSSVEEAQIRPRMCRCQEPNRRARKRSQDPDAALFFKHILWTKSELIPEIQQGNVPPWCTRSYADFDQRLSDSSFPCTMGVAAHRKGTLLFGFAPSAEAPEGLWQVRQIFIDYLEAIKELPAQEAVMVVLIIFFEPMSQDLSWEKYNEIAWRVLQFQHDHDPSPWPHGIPTDYADPQWAFCFGGVPLFVNVSLPVFQNRASRNLGLGMTWVVNPRDAFEIIGSNTPVGREIRMQIRNKICHYDKIGPSPELGFYGQPDSHEWRQYILPDTNDPESRRECPLHIRRH